ncbi:MAG: sigma-70 family RNA polymerase sigma factor [Planctomycetes bacterium]|nr:sigma-70 family RNA polymerase sigma factor [Planctomycetota bacterium]
MSQTEDADKFLVVAIRKGDQRAWHQLIERYQGRLLAFARSRLRNPGEAEDALQETFLGFVTSLPHFDESRSLETYLFAILRYKIGEVLSKKQRAAELTSGFDIDDDSRGGGVDPAVRETPSSAALAIERERQQEEVLARILRRLIEELRDKSRLDDLQVVELLFYVGLRNKEAGERLGRDEKAVAGVKFRALGRLREFFEELAVRERELIDTDTLSSEATIARVWRRRLSCLKRGTIGSHLLGVLEEPWHSYTVFHLDTIQCLMCKANVEDLSAESERVMNPELSDRLFQTSVGFLSQHA